VIGLLTDEKGEPLAVRVFEGNTADPAPQGGMPERIRVVKEQFGVGELVFVGDRGMVKAPEQEALNAQGFGRRGVADELVCRDAGGGGRSGASLRAA
jgi:hypothetical protein